MRVSISHDWSEESPEAKARWFQTLSYSERLEMLFYFYELSLSRNPDLLERKDAEPIPGRIQVLTRPRD